MERDEPTRKFLLYSPTEEPDYEDDWLLDIRLYSRSFRADRASILLQELGLVNQHLRTHVADRRKFFDAKDRLQKIKNLVTPDDVAADLDRKMIAVVAKADAGAQLEIQYLGISEFTVTVPPEFRADLFGIGARSTPTILGTDYFAGDASLGTGTLIEEAFVTPSTIPGRLTTSGSSLLNFIHSLYQTDGTPIGPYAVFRVNPDVGLPPFSLPYRGFELAAADNTDAGGVYVPRLTLTTSAVPEPSTFGQLLAGAASLFRTSGRSQPRTHTPMVPTSSLGAPPDGHAARATFY